MLLLFSSVVLEPIDWAAICLVFVIVGGIFLAFFLYFRTAFKAGGWKNVKNSAWIALVAFVLFVIDRLLQNREINDLKQFVNGLFK
jgi:hypothetical protein